MKIDKEIIKVFKGNIPNKEEKSPLSSSQCLLEVWELTKEVFSLSKKYDVESRLQRDVIHLTRRKS